MLNGPLGIECIPESLVVVRPPLVRELPDGEVWIAVSPGRNVHARREFTSDTSQGGKILEQFAEFDEAVDAPRRLGRVSNQYGDRDEFGADAALVDVEAVFAEGLAVLRDDDHHGVIEKFGRPEKFDEFPDCVVHVRNRRVVELSDGIEVGVTLDFEVSRGDLTLVARVHGGGESLAVFRLRIVVFVGVEQVPVEQDRAFRLRITDERLSTGEYPVGLGNVGPLTARPGGLRDDVVEDEAPLPDGIEMFGEFDLVVVEREAVPPEGVQDEQDHVAEPPDRGCLHRAG